MMERDELLVYITSVELQIEEYFVQDDFVIPSYLGPHLLATSYAGRLALLTPAGRTVRAVPHAIATKILELAMLARDERVEGGGVDTGIGRTLTYLFLDFRDARGPSDSFTASFTINHNLIRVVPSVWSSLLRTLRDASGALPAAAGDAWDLALTWTSPIDLGSVWRAGGAVRLPHVVTAFEHEGPLFLRVGQLTPPQLPEREDARPSQLYRLLDRTLVCVDDGRILEPTQDHPMRWVLPCGGGVVMHHPEWRPPHRTVVRVDDLDRGIYVQPG